MKWWKRVVVLFVFLVGCVTSFVLGQKYEKFELVKVVDGDTLMVKSKRDGREIRLRIWGIDAPELTDCAGGEAKNNLEKIIKDGDFDNQVVGYDSFGRIVAKATIDGVDVADGQLRAGLASVDDGLKDHIKAAMKPDSEYLRILRASEQVAKDSSLGVWSQECREKIEKTDPKCVIKGNYADGKMRYYLPSCKEYDRVVIQPKAGDRWFCSQSQAEATGFTMAASCQ